MLCQILKEEVITMTELAVLEARIRALESIEAIKKVKAKYWRCLDKKLWDEMADVFTEDAVWHRADGKEFNGRKAIIEHISQELGLWQSNVVTTHRGHQPEIEMTSDTTAKALWALDDDLRRPSTELKGWAYYEDEYVKENDGWRIKSVKFAFIHRDTSTRETQPLWWKV